MSRPPKVSVVTVTYNQEQYIAQALASVLAQETDFEFEMIVGEDCSTDRTRSIVEQMAAQRPGIIRLLARPANLGPAANFQDAIGQCRGEYIALLEGDDYWTDPRKLQKQVDALAQNPDWTVCFHWVRVTSVDGTQPDVLFPPQRYDRVLTIDDLFRRNCIQSCSVMYRRIMDEYPPWLLTLAVGDWPLHILHADRGHIGFLPEEMAVYRVHQKGVWSMTSKISRFRATLDMLAAVDRHFEGRYHRKISATRRRMTAAMYRARFAEALWSPICRGVAGVHWLQRKFVTLGSEPERTPD